MIQKAIDSAKKAKLRKLKKNARIAHKAKEINASKENNKNKKIVWTKTRFIKFFTYWGAVVCFFAWLLWDIPMPSKLVTQQIPVSTKIYDRNGELLYEIYADKKSTPYKLSEIPDHVKNATIAIEDKDFYKHSGVSIAGITRAFYKTIVEGKLQGGSTLTQQLVKNSLLTPERTIRRKIREFLLTQVVEIVYSKDQILEMYLNQSPYGGTAYGIGAAAETYFGKSPSELTLAEAALLAGLPQAPTRYSPFGAYPELASQRQQSVLRRMVEDGYISQEEAENAINEKLNYSERNTFKAPHFSLWIKSLLAEKYGEAVVEKGGLRVTTTLDLSLQEFAQNAVATEVAKLAKQNVKNGAVIVTHPSTGQILAMVGSKDYNAKDEDGKVNVIFSKRQPGSAIKPLNYALAIEDRKITASTPLADVPTCFLVTGQSPYCPKNYDGSFHGAVQTRFALANSYNIPAVRVLALNGIEKFVEFANKMGLKTLSDTSRYGLSLTLGGGEVRPYDMAVAFGIFANGGILQPLTGILKVEDYKGKILEKFDINNTLSGERIISPETAFIISHMLHDNGARSATFGLNSFLNVRGHPEVSVKTGTTNDLKDNWTVGYTAHAVVVTWVGNNDYSSMSGTVSGVSGASPIWNTVIKKVLEKAEEGSYHPNDRGHAWPKKPNDVVGATVCATNGNRVSDPNLPECPTRFEYFLKDKVGAGIQAGYMDLIIDKSTGVIATPDIPPENLETQNKPYLSDPLGTIVCLDCPIPSNFIKIRYPLSSAKAQ
ncbi:MAG: penicillin-binding protein [Patescibacteria group bacterium]|nr:penicillin-binding protein [Patescibacteria group bacterium]